MRQLIGPFPSPSASPEPSYPFPLTQAVSPDPQVRQLVHPALLAASYTGDRAAIAAAAVQELEEGLVGCLHELARLQVGLLPEDLLMSCLGAWLSECPICDEVPWRLVPHM